MDERHPCGLIGGADESEGIGHFIKADSACDQQVRSQSPGGDEIQ